MPTEERSFAAGALIRGRGVRHKMVSDRADLSDDSKVRPSNWNDQHIGSSEWDEVIVKAANQGVTNSATLVNDNELKFTVKSGELWQFDLMAIYDSDSTGDIKVDMSMSSGTGQWKEHHIGESTSNAIVHAAVLNSNSANFTTIAAGGSTGGGARTLQVTGVVRPDGDAIVYVRFAQNTQTAGQTATMRAGSVLKVKKLA